MIRWACEAEVDDNGAQTRVRMSWCLGTEPIGLKLDVLLGRDKLFGGIFKDE